MCLVGTSVGSSISPAGPASWLREVADLPDRNIRHEAGDQGREARPDPRAERGRPARDRRGDKVLDNPPYEVSGTAGNNPLNKG
jgi:hypothetical protein